MIKTRRGVTEIKGTRVEIIADISVIFKSLLEETDITREEIIEALDDAGKSKAKLKEEIDEWVRELLEEVRQKIKKMEEGTK